MFDLVLKYLVGDREHRVLLDMNLHFLTRSEISMLKALILS